MAILVSVINVIILIVNLAFSMAINQAKRDIAGALVPFENRLNVVEVRWGNTKDLSIRNEDAIRKLEAGLECPAGG